jgi:FAD/FMN-containing dehydrogenase
MVFTERSRSESPVTAAAMREFQRTLLGEVILPEDPRYDEERQLFNAAIDRRPQMIVRVADARDAALALAFARQYDIPIAARGGGHSTPGHSMVEGGMVIDLSLRKSVTIDPERQIARAGAGLRAGEYIAQVEKYGFVSPIGDASHTGLSGLTLGGGYGWLSGKLGLAIDNLVSVEIVTADSRILHASTDENPDLFWAIRGGSGNFGVVTTLEYRLTPLQQVLGGMLVFPFPMAREVLQTYRRVTESAPDELTTYAALATMPDGNAVAVVMLCYSGEIAQGEQVIAPLRALGPVAGHVGPMPYSGMTALTDPLAPLGLAREDRWFNVTGMTDETIDTVIAYASPARSLGNAIIIKQLNGAATRVAPDATAFPHRRAHYSIMPLAQWPPHIDGAAHIAWMDQVEAALAPITFGVYVNGAPEHIPATLVYGGNYDRLVQIKNRFDPTNMFRGNSNIVPTIG